MPSTVVQPLPLSHSRGVCVCVCVHTVCVYTFHVRAPTSQSSNALNFPHPESFLSGVQPGVEQRSVTEKHHN